MKLSIHVAVDPKETPLDQIASMKAEAVQETMLAVHDALRAQTEALSSDPGRYHPNTPSLAESYKAVPEGTLRAVIGTDSFYGRYLMHGNPTNGTGKDEGYIVPTMSKFMKFRRRDTGEWVYAKRVRPLNPNNIHVTVPRPYSFRRDVVDYAMRHGAEHALDVLNGRESWRGVLQVRLTEL
jgi:hypothetical protein